MQLARAVSTIGHSTRSIEELIELLREHSIEILVDVRRYPGSRRNPQFGKDALAESLRASGIEYRHEVDLGGRRAPRKDSPNGAWRNDAFRGYADHAQSKVFESALTRVLDLAATRNIALMCAEAHPSRCHRRILSDVIAARGRPVEHILHRGRVEAHALDPAARPTRDGLLVYPASAQRELEF